MNQVGRVITVFLCISCFLGCGKENKINAQTLQNGLIAYYPFNGNVNDESGHGNDGILRGEYQFVDGIKNQAIRLLCHGYSDSLGGHVLLPNFHFTSMPSFSYAMWVKEESLRVSEQYISFRDDLGSNGLSYAGIYHLPDIDSIDFQVGLTITDHPLRVPFLPSYAHSFVHYSLVYSGGIMEAYINGELVGQKRQPVNVDGIYSGIARHWWHNNTSTRFTGVIDEVRIYNRALTGGEIQELYHEGGFAEGSPDSESQYLEIYTFLNGGEDNYLRLTISKINSVSEDHFITDQMGSLSFFIPNEDECTEFQGGTNCHLFLLPIRSLPSQLHSDKQIYVIRSKFERPGMTLTVFDPNAHREFDIQEYALHSASDGGLICRLLIPPNLPTDGSYYFGLSPQQHNDIRFASCIVADIIFRYLDQAAVQESYRSGFEENFYESYYQTMPYEKYYYHDR